MTQQLELFTLMKTVYKIIHIKESNEIFLINPDGTTAGKFPTHLAAHQFMNERHKIRRKIL